MPRRSSCAVARGDAGGGDGGNDRGLDSGCSPFATLSGECEEAEMLWPTSQSDGESENDGSGISRQSGHWILDSLPPELATGRPGVDELLDAMFTERSVDVMTCDADGYDVEEMQCGNEDNTDVEGVLDDHNQWEDEQEANASDLMNENQRTICDMKQHQDGQHAAFVSLVIQTSEAPSSFAQPIAYSDRPETTIVMAPTEIHASNAACKSFNTTSPQSPELRRIITFDVGGRLFRCKESLIRKYPTKRLNQIITCGCEQTHGDTFFIDRNPQHFEIVLDWYRTGTYAQHPLMNEAALKEDAKYFDVYDDLFPQRDGSKTSNLIPPVPPRPQRRLLPQATMSKPFFDSSSNVSASEESPPQSTAIHQSYPEQPATQVKIVHKSSRDENVITRFSKTELRKIVWNGVPVVYMVRSHEQLVVASVIGHGKLHVRVCDATGVQAVYVDHAVLFDSQSYFYLQGGRAKLQHCLLPGGFTYTFWMELVPDSAARAGAAISFPNNGKQTNVAEGDNTNGPSPQNSVGRMQLEVEFKLLASFQGDEKLADSVDDELQYLTGTGGRFGERVKPTLESFKDETTQAFSPFLFLPPHHKMHSPVSPLPELQPQQHAQEKHEQKHSTAWIPRTNVVEAVSNRDKVAKQIFETSTLLNHAHLNHQRSLQNKIAAAASAMNARKAAIVGANTNLGVGQVSPSSSIIKRNGASIVLGNQQRHGRDLSSNNNGLGGKITVYKQAQLTIEDSPRESLLTKRNLKNTKHGIATGTGPPGFTKYQDQQPRLFR